jgi:hypothetical protein
MFKPLVLAFSVFPPCPMLRTCSFSYALCPKSKSKPCYDRLSVSQYVLVLSPFCNLWPDIIFCMKVSVLSLWGALYDEMSGLSPVSHCHQCLVHCQRFNIIYIVHVTCFKYIYAIYTRPLSAQAQYSRSCHNVRCNSSLEVWTVVRLIDAKFWHFLLITSWHGRHRKHRSSLLYLLVAVKTCSIAKWLLSNGSLAYDFHGCCLRTSVYVTSISTDVIINQKF